MLKKARQRYTFYSKPTKKPVKIIEKQRFFLQGKGKIAIFAEILTPLILEKTFIKAHEQHD
ncbi:MAG: hypothetical protein IKT00_10005 [Prevotella sp.]|nr:hypothetical protein [Prevotella sp.]